MRVGVVFPGQGSQVVGMGVDAARAYPAAAECFACAKTVLGYDLLALCERGPEERLRETRYSQPAIFVTNVALALSLADVLEPVAGAGHSFGEYCALTLAGALTFETALTLVNERGLPIRRAASSRRRSSAAPGACSSRTSTRRDRSSSAATPRRCGSPASWRPTPARSASSRSTSRVRGTAR